MPMGITFYHRYDTEDSDLIYLLMNKIIFIFVFFYCVYKEICFVLKVFIQK